MKTSDMNRIIFDTLSKECIDNKIVFCLISYLDKEITRERALGKISEIIRGNRDNICKSMIRRTEEILETNF